MTSRQYYYAADAAGMGTLLFLIACVLSLSWFQQFP